MQSPTLQRLEELTEEISAAQGLLLNLFKYSLDGLIITDSDASFKYTNTGWERILGYTSDELKSKPLLGFVYEEDRASVLKKLEDLQNNSTPIIKCRNKWIAKDGTLVWVCWTATTTPTDDFVYIVGRKLDNVTEPI